MTAEKTAIQIFEDFGGVDHSRSDLRRDFRSFENLTNMQYGYAGEIVGRKGFQPTGLYGNFRGGGLYTYLDPTTGASMEEVLVCNDQLFRLKQGTINITYSGITNWWYQVSFVTNQYQFRLYENGVAVLTQNLGTGLTAIEYTIRELAAAIDALANFAATITPSGPFAQVNGAQSAVTTVTVDAGHSLAALQWLAFYDHRREQLVAVKVTATAATTFSFNTNHPTVSVEDNQVIGPHASPAASLTPTLAASNLGAASTIPFYYWDPVIYNVYSALTYGPFVPMAQTVYKAYRQAHFVSPGNNNCYIGVTRAIALLPDQSDLDYDGKMLKYDGQRVYRAGMPEGDATSFTPGAGANTWRYMVTRQQRDNRGIYTEGNPSPTFTVSAAATPVTCVINTLNNSSHDFATFNSACALINGNQSGAGTQTGLTVTNTPHTLMPGDTVAIYDATTAGIVYRTLTAVTATTISWASTTAINVLNGEPVSCGLINRIWRTKDSGLTFYLVKEYPNNFFAATTSLSDGLADTALTIEYEEPDDFRLHDLPPAMNFLCVHQGCLVGTGDRGNPNTVHISNPGEFEYWPRAFGNFDVASSVLGGIRAIGSDSDNRLAIFKQSAYYDVEGNISQPGGYSIRTSHEGDYGVVSQFSLAKIKDQLCGISLLGPIAVSDGVLSPEFGKAVSSDYSALDLSDEAAAFGANDKRNLLYRSHTYNGSNALNIGFVADYEQVKDREHLVSDEEGNVFWFDWTYSGGASPNRGIVVTSTDLFNIGEHQLFREMSVPGSSKEENALNYIDGDSPITYRINTTSFHLGIPEVDKQWLRVLLYSLDD